jgi:hypothetical protein
MDVGLVREDVYLVVVARSLNPATTNMLDDATFAIVRKVLNPKDGSFYLFCRMCLSEDCDCTEAVRTFRRSLFLDN